MVAASAKSRGVADSPKASLVSTIDVNGFFEATLVTLVDGLALSTPVPTAESGQPA